MGTFTINQLQRGKNLCLIPSNDGCNIDLTPIGESENYLCIDDPITTPDEDATYVESHVTDLAYDLYLLPNHTTESGTINYVQIYGRAKSDIHAQAETGIFKLILTDNACGNIYKSNGINLSTVYTTYNNIWTTNPRTAAAWSWSDIDNLQIGIECSSPTIIGDAFTSTFRPNAIGFVDNHQKKDCHVNYMCVDEEVSDGDDTYLTSAIVDAWRTDLYNIPDHTTETGVISKIVIFAVMRWNNNNGDEPDAKIGLRINGSNYWGDSFPVGNTTYSVYSKEWTTNPDTAAAWTWDNIDDLQIGWQSYNYDTYTIHNTQVYMIVYYTEDINPEIRTTQVYAEINYDEETICSLNIPTQVSVDHQQNIKMLNFWSGNRAVYGLARNKRTMVLTGTQHDSTACTEIECVRAMGEAGDEITIAGLGSNQFDKTFRIISFGWRKISDKPLTMDWILELEYAA